MTGSDSGRPGQDLTMDWQAFDDEAPEETSSADSMAGFGAMGDSDPAGANVHPARFMSLSDDPVSGGYQSIDLLRDVEVELTVELGSTRMLIKHILGLRPGSVVELNRLAGEPVDIMVNKTLIARGEVVVVDEKFAIRVVEIVPPERRLGGI